MPILQTLIAIFCFFLPGVRNLHPFRMCNMFKSTYDEVKGDAKFENITLNLEMTFFDKSQVQQVLDKRLH